MDLNTKLTNLNDLYCTECRSFLNPPIMLMKNAENICGCCFISKICVRSDYTPNLALDKIIRNLTNPCHFKSEGCKMQLSYTEITMHQIVCKYRKHKCPTSDCLWSGALENILEHFELTHNEAVIKTNSSLFKFAVDISQMSNPRDNLLVWNSELFYLVTYIDRDMLCFVLSYLRLDEQVNVLEYCVEEIGDLKGICFKKNDRRPVSIYSSQAYDEAIRVDLRILRMCKSEVLQVKLQIFGSGTVEQIDENILSQLECPICDTYMFPPINQCLLGHSICNKCRPKLGQCPTCRGRIENTRNYALEALTTATKYPCLNRSKGCDAVVPGSLLEKHQQECKFQDFTCPIENCVWRGRTSQLICHLTMQHEMTDQNQIKITLPNRPPNLPNLRNDFTRTVIAYGEVFKISYRFSNNTTSWACKVVGQQNRNKFKYDIVYCNQNQDCELVKKSTCHVFTKNEEFFDKCLNITQNLTIHFGKDVICKIYLNNISM